MVELKRPSQEVLRLRNSTLIPTTASERTCGLMVAPPSVDILWTLAPDHG